MADEKEVTVKILTEIQDDDVKDLEDRLEELNDKEVEVDVTSDSSEVDNVESSVEDLETEIENVNNTTVSPMGDSSGVDSVSESVSGLQEALTAVSAGVSLAGMEQLVDTAGNINDSWNRLGLTFGEVSGQMKTDISEAGEATGRSGGLIRQYFNDMGIAGVTNTQLLQESFEALSGRAYQTGNSIESMEQKMKMMVMSGNAGARQLTQLGISTEDLGRAMGVSADEASKMFKTLSQEERLRVLTKAMGDGKNANDMYKNSWQGLKDQVDKATGALMGAVGNMILPFLIPAMKVATQAIEALSAGFKALPAPIQGVIGGVLAVVMGFLALATVVSTIRAVANAIQLVSTMTTMWSTVTKIATAAQNALNLSMLANPILLLVAALAVLIGYMVYLYSTNEQCRASVNKLGEDLQRIASGDYSALRDVGNDLLAASDSFAQASGFAALIGQENYNAWVNFRNSMVQTVTDMLTQTGQQFLQLPTYIIQATQQGIAQFQAFLGQVSGILSSIIGNVASFGGNLVSQLGSAASNAASSFLSGISGLASGFINELSNMLSYAVSWASSLASQMASAASNAVSSFLGGLAIHSPGIMQRKFIGEMEGIVTAAQDTEQPLGSAMNNVASSAVSNFGITGLNTNMGNIGSNNGAGSVINNFNFTFMDFIEDKEKLKEFIVKTITDEVEWDNTTAGRTV